MRTSEKPETVLRTGSNDAAETLISLQNVVKTYITPAGSFKALKGSTC
jgi:hypothetical protein